MDNEYILISQGELIFGDLAGLFLGQLKQCDKYISSSSNGGDHPLAGGFTDDGWTLGSTLCGSHCHCSSSLLSGMAGRLETLCGQAYGARQYHKLGNYIHAAIISLVLVCIPIRLLWIFMDKLITDSCPPRSLYFY